jgi:hypothetical protein
MYDTQSLALDPAAATLLELEGTDVEPLWELRPELPPLLFNTAGFVQVASP